MTLSRTHLALLGIVSVFTGVISPVVKTNGGVFPFPLTDLQIYAYVVLLMLIVLCICLAYRAWNLMRIVGLILLVLIVILYIGVMQDGVHTSTGVVTTGLSWGWIFFVIGLICILWSTWWDMLDEASGLSDRLLSLLAGITILGLSILIIWISYMPSGEVSMRNKIIEGTLGTGSTETYSGMILSRAYPSIDRLIFDRSHDMIRFFVSSGSQMISLPSGQVYDRLPHATIQIQDSTYTITADNTVMTESGDILGHAPMPQNSENIILISTGSGLYSIWKNGPRVYPWTHTAVQHIASSRNGENIAWTEIQSGTISLYRDGTQIPRSTSGSISRIALSDDGTSIMTVEIWTDGISYLTKNWDLMETLSPNMISTSLEINGIDRIYAVEQDETISIIHNGTLSDRKLDEVREIFLGTRAGGYAYFGRPLWEKNYCLYTRYHGNLCGLSGYMNPRIAPDGSIVYAGLKDGNWGIYRDTNALVRNTGYPNTGDISRDYVFFDMTNPKSYLFINWQVPENYRLYKRWTWITWSWKDVWLDPGFGYDNKIIMSVQDESGWRVMEF
jgi:hypothetical protein